MKGDPTIQEKKGETWRVQFTNLRSFSPPRATAETIEGDCLHRILSIAGKLTELTGRNHGS